MKKILAIILCALIMLSLTACTGNDKPTAPTAEPTEEAVLKSEQPAGEPSAYPFNEKTGEYSDEYIIMTLPAGFDVNVRTDMKVKDAEASAGYMRYFVFKNSVLPENTVSYTVKKAEFGENISAMGQEAFEAMYEETFKRAYQSEIEIKTVNFDKSLLGSLPVVLYEYDVTVAGVTLHQLVKLIQESDNLITVTYTYSEDDGDIYRKSAASINLIDSSGI